MTTYWKSLFLLFITSVALSTPKSPHSHLGWIDRIGFTPDHLIKAFEENKVGDPIHSKLIESHRNRRIHLVYNGRLLEASILAASFDKNTEGVIQKLKRARQFVFDEFKKADPEYTFEDWALVKELDPIYHPDTYVIVLEDAITGEIVGNLKMVYDHPSRQLPAEIRFPGMYQRPEPMLSNINYFNVLSGKHHPYDRSLIGGAIQIMEFVSPLYASLMMFLTNFVLMEHPRVTITEKGNQIAVYPAEVISYNDKKLEDFYDRLRMEKIADVNGYQLRRMPIDSFKKLYRSSFVFRPGTKQINDRGTLMYEINRDAMIGISDIFTDANPREVEINMEKITPILNHLKKFPSTHPAIQESQRYLQWISEGNRECHYFYKTSL